MGSIATGNINVEILRHLHTCTESYPSSEQFTLPATITKGFTRKVSKASSHKTTSCCDHPIVELLAAREKSSCDLSQLLVAELDKGLLAGLQFGEEELTHLLCGNSLDLLRLVFSLIRHIHFLSVRVTQEASGSCLVLVSGSLASSTELDTPSFALSPEL